MTELTTSTTWCYSTWLKWCWLNTLCLRYCFGAPYVCNELAGNTCSAGAFAHPAFLKEHHFRQIKSERELPPLERSKIDKEKKDTVTLTWLDSKEPLFLSCSGVDHTFPTEARREAVDILRQDKKTYNVQLFSGVEHGFALRGNMENPYEREFVHTRGACWNPKYDFGWQDSDF